MTDSSSYTSLFALVDSHLSKTSLQENGGNSNITSTFNIPSLHNLRNGSVSESLLPPHARPRLPIPTLGLSKSPIQTVLAQQVANMLRAKEKRQEEEEKQKIESEMRRLKIEDEENLFIDLVKAIQTPYNPEPRINQDVTLSRNSSVESLYETNFIVSDSEPEPVLPCVTDMSYILKEKVKMGRPSAFARVLTSRLRPVAAPYLRKKIPTSIKRFDFSTPSPCDVIKANLRKPTMSCAFTMDITKFV